MRVLATMPGRYGDILWALPTVRALSEAYGTPVDLVLSEKYSSLDTLLSRQPYLADVFVDPEWEVQETAPITPRTPPDGLVRRREAPPQYDAVYHLGYESWPEPTLAEDIYNRTFLACKQRHIQVDHAVDYFPVLDLTTPWITPPTMTRDSSRPLVWIGWSEEWFELKVGLLVALAARFKQVDFQWLRPWGGRYDEVDYLVEEVREQPLQNQRYHRLGPNVEMIRATWVTTAGMGGLAACYLGCLSASWVLANALGVPTVIVEPNPQRHHPTFWREAPQNHLVRGNDGLPTFDARHAGDVLEGVLRGD